MKLPQPKSSRTSASTRKKAKSDSEEGWHPHKPSTKRSRATVDALEREGRRSASSQALSRQAKSADSKRTRKERSAAGKKAAKTELDADSPGVNSLSPACKTHWVEQDSYTSAEKITLFPS